MRFFLFKLLFRLTWWVAPERKQVNQMFDIYLNLLEKERQWQICQKRQVELDACTRPKTYPKVRKGQHCTYTDFWDDDSYYD